MIMTTKNDYWALAAPSIENATSQPGLPENVLLVTIDSDSEHTAAVHSMFAYFRKEYRYDFDQDHSAIEEDPTSHGFLWLNEEEGQGKQVVGGCCFRQKKVRDEDVWFLVWAWFHPYERRKGQLKAAWSYFKETFGDFYVEPPYSKDMRSFLIAQEGNSNWGHLKRSH
jgi:hypothetical protein